MKATFAPALAAALLACAHAQTGASSALTESPRLPPVADVDLSILDPAVAPCTDFFTHACGGWLQKTAIPADRPRWARSFDEIDDRNLTKLRGYLDADAAGKGDPSDPYTDKLGSFWASCMDEGQVEKTGLATLQTELARVEAVKDPASLATVLATLHGQAVGAFFEFSSGQDFKDATQVIGQLDQGGLGLPDRDFYLKDDARTKEIRALYEKHLAAVFALLGEAAPRASADAQTVLKLETQLATASMDRTARRDPKNVYHRLDLAGIQQAAPGFAWTAWLAGLGHPEIRAINVAAPDFFKALDRLVTQTPPADLRTYLRWRVADALTPALPDAFVQEQFQFKSKAFTGASQILPRWKRCLGVLNATFGQALARPFIRETFGEDGKARNLARVKAIELAMGAELDKLAWMDADTRKRAKEKLALVANQIGYPDKWRDYGALQIDRGSYLHNLLRAEAYEVQRDLAKIGKPVDRTDWDMQPHQVNAYYDPSRNEMVFPAGILQPPFFNRASDEASNYGGIGMVMGHELTHGFDDEGREFDGHGNLTDWWTAASGKAFTERAACVERQAGQYVAIDDLHLNGKLTLGENLADLGGLTLAYRAYVANKKSTREIGGYTPEQQFFLAFAQAWCAKARPEFQRLMVTVNPHSAEKFRVNGPLSNLREFRQAFGCKAGDAMVRPEAERCEIW